MNHSWFYHTAQSGNLIPSRINSNQHAVPAHQSRLYVLDGIRGVAAISVMAFHLKGLIVTTVALPSAYLAVDLFFILSGYILSKLYDLNLMAGKGTIWFLKRRILRLYPVYILASTVSLSGFLLSMISGSRAIFGSYGQLFFAYISNVFFLPTPSLQLHNFLFPLNSPAWSIALENISKHLLCIID